MDGANQSVVSEFLFLGLTNSWEIQLLLFVFSSTFFMASMMGNSLIILTVTCDPHLHSPMYFLLANLSFIEGHIHHSVAFNFHTLYIIDSSLSA